MDPKNPDLDTPLCFQLTIYQLINLFFQSHTSASFSDHSRIPDDAEIHVEAVNTRGERCVLAENPCEDFIQYLVELHVGGSFVRGRWQFDPAREAEAAHHKRAAEATFRDLCRLLGMRADWIIQVTEV